MAISKGQGITAASLVAAIPIVLGADAALDARYQPVGEYVTVSQMQDLSVDIWYGQFFDRLDDLDESKAEGNDRLVDLYTRQLQRLLAKICAVEPEFEYCESGIE